MLLYSVLVVEPDMNVFHDLEEHKRGLLRLREATSWHDAEVLPLDRLCQRLIEFSLTTLHPFGEGVGHCVGLPLPVIRAVLVFLVNLRRLAFAFCLEVMRRLNDFFVAIEAFPDKDSVVAPVLLQVTHLSHNFVIFMLDDPQEGRLTPPFHLL